MSSTPEREPEPREERFTPPGVPEEWRKYFDEEGQRWNAREQRIDWLRVFIMMLIFLAAELPIYFLEHGLR